MHQISKKKLERVTVQGGDFGMAGQRTSGEMTVSHLRKLLEDDVEDLAKRALSPEVRTGYGLLRGFAFEPEQFTPRIDISLSI